MGTVLVVVYHSTVHVLEGNMGHHTSCLSVVVRVRKACLVPDSSWAFLV